MVDEKETKFYSLVFSYLELRTVIGILGIALPFLVSLGGLIIFRDGIQASISSYYHTGMRDVMVGTLFVMGFFMLSYRGYERADNIAGNLACVFAIGVALFPTAPEYGATRLQEIIAYVHLGFAVLFFLTLIYFCLVLFTKTDPDKPPTDKKLQRNKVYRFCGYLMSLSVFLMAIHEVLPQPVVEPLSWLKAIYWLETISILAFGVSWFVKGGAIMKDETKA
jgi:hypothetical protein